MQNVSIISRVCMLITPLYLDSGVDLSHSYLALWKRCFYCLREDIGMLHCLEKTEILESCDTLFILFVLLYFTRLYRDCPSDVDICFNLKFSLYQ